MLHAMYMCVLHVHVHGALQVLRTYMDLSTSNAEVVLVDYLKHGSSHFAAGTWAATSTHLIFVDSIITVDGMPASGEPHQSGIAFFKIFLFTMSQLHVTVSANTLRFAFKTLRALLGKAQSMQLANTQPLPWALVMPEEGVWQWRVAEFALLAADGLKPLHFSGRERGGCDACFTFR